MKNFHVRVEKDTDYMGGDVAALSISSNGYQWHTIGCLGVREIRLIIRALRMYAKDKQNVGLSRVEDEK